MLADARSFDRRIPATRPDFCARFSVGCLLLLAGWVLAHPSQAAVPPSPEPPVSVIFPGRTYDPGEPLVTPIGSGTKYYVDDANGNDANDGRSLGTAFRTIGRAFDSHQLTLMPGDTILVRGGLYRGGVVLGNAMGAPGNPIVLGPYGDGEVIIDNSPAVTGWTLHAGETYRVTPGFEPVAVVVDNQPLYRETSLAALQAAPAVAGVPAALRYVYDSASGDLYVRVSGGSPAGRDVGVLKDDRYGVDGITVNNSNYLTLYGLTVRFSSARGINVLGDHVRLERNKVLFNTYAGISGFGYGSTLTTDLQVVKNFAYYNMMGNWPRGRWPYGGWAAGIGLGGAPNVLFEGNISQKSGGEGILAYAGAGATFRNNVSLDNFSVSYYFDNRKDGVLEGNVAICHTPTLADVYNNDLDPADEFFAKNVRRLRAEGIMTADEEYSLTPPANLENVLIRNNVVIGCRRGFNHYAAATGSALKNVRFLNNTIIMPTDLLPEHEYDASGGTAIAGIVIPWNGGGNTGSVFENNLVVGGYPKAFLLYSEGMPAGQTDKFLGLSLSHNLWYQPNAPSPIHWGADWSSAYDYTHTQWLALSGAAHGAGDLTGDPILVDPGTDLVADKKPQSGSPAVDAGIAIAEVLTDFEGLARPQGSAYDIGAFEGSGPPDTTPPAGLLTINAGAQVTASLAATLTLNATDDIGVSAYLVSASPTPPAAEAAGWVVVPATASFGGSVPVALSGGDGTKTVYAWYRDAAGNVSAAASDSILLDQTAPSDGTLTASAGSGQIALQWAGAVDAGSGLAASNPYRLVFQTGGVPAAACTSGTQIYQGAGTSFTHTGRANGTTHSYRLCAIDAAGNTSSGPTASATPQAPKTLTVTTGGTGSGTVTSTPGGVSCGSDCSETYAYNTVVTLSATPGSGSIFLGWTGDCTGTGACTLTLSQARAVTARFSALLFADDPLVVRATLVKAAHVLELRTAIDTLRTRAGLLPFDWTDPTLSPRLTPVLGSHLLELRTALSQAYAAAGRPTPIYAEPTITARATPIKAAHLTELRLFIHALE
jgi:hypothetical protein